MAAPTTIQDLPDDMLHEIFGHVFAAEPKTKKLDLYTHLPPEGAHLALRCACRRWRDIADWVRLSTARICVDTSEFADDGAVRARHPTAFKKVVLFNSTVAHSASVSRAAASLINGSADFRRSIANLQLEPCCLPALLPAVTTVTSCTALTGLQLYWKAHKKERAVPSNVLAPLSALRMLETLTYGHGYSSEALPTSAVLAPLPALPDAPRLTCFIISTTGNFVPVGSDAALGRLRAVQFDHKAPLQELVDAEDPFLLRAAFDAGTWQPSRLSGLKQLHVSLDPVSDSRAPKRPSRTGSRPGSEWAPLAGQVTLLNVRVKSDGYKRPSTGILAGLGALTGLRCLGIGIDIPSARTSLLEIAFIDRLRTPHMMQLEYSCVSAPASVAHLPNLVTLKLASIAPYQPPIKLRSLVARSSLKHLILFGHDLSAPGLINLAELFVGGGGWPVLEDLILKNLVLEWDETRLAGAPTAAEFSERARQLLPALDYVEIDEPRGRNALADRSRIGFVVASRRHVVPTLKGMNTVGI